MTKSILWDAKEAALSTGGALHGMNSWKATGLSMDSRTVQQGDLFIAIIGDAMDGHQFVKNALDKGAVAAIVTYRPENVPEDASLLIVEDTLEAMQKLGIDARKRSAAKRIGITGSVGKTSTKELLATALRSLTSVHASDKSYNNHWGVPYSLASMLSENKYGVFEMGMNHAGEITPLSEFVQPDIAIITRIAEVHIEHFANIYGIADAKAEIFQGMREGGMALLNADDGFYDYISAKAERLGLECYRFGESKGAHAALLKYRLEDGVSHVTADILGEEIQYKLNVPGKHIALNSLAVLLAVELLGEDTRKAARALSSLMPLPGRGKQHILPNNQILIDEGYNASVASMEASFDVLSTFEGQRKVAILGDMLEMGAHGPEMHAGLANSLVKNKVDQVFTCGKLMKNLHDALPEALKGLHTENSHKMAEKIKEALLPGDVILVKGSNGSKMTVVIEALLAE